MTTPGRSAPNRILMWVYFVVNIVVPSLLFLWGMGQIDEGVLASPHLQKTAFLFLLLWILPVYFVYSGISVRRFFPVGLTGALRYFVPAVIAVGLYAGSFKTWPSRLTAWMLTATPLFVGFMGLLLGGLLVLVFRKNDLGRDSSSIAFGVALVGAASLPVLYVFGVGLKLNIAFAGSDTSMTITVARYLICVGQVVLFNAPLIRTLYLERSL